MSLFIQNGLEAGWLKSFKEPDNNELIVGAVILTQTGQELASICSPEPIVGYIDYVLRNWVKKGYKVNLV